MENQDIDKMFNKAGKSEEENTTFPNFEKVWQKVEKKLDKKEEKKRIIPIWLPYGIAAGLALTFGVLYFMNDGETSNKPQIADRVAGKPVQNQQSDSLKIQNLDRQIQENIAANPIENSGEIIAYQNAPIPPKVEVYVVPPIRDYVINDPIADKVAYAVPPPPPSSSAKASVTNSIEGIVVTAMGIKKEKKSVGYASTTVTSEVLNGRVSGLKIGDSGDKKVTIRGVSSIKNNEHPLYVLDGKVYEGNILSSINSEKIESVNVLKGAAATAIYGAKAKNGVIVVESKNLTKSEKRKLKRAFKKVDKNSISIIEEPKSETEIPDAELPEAGKLTAGEVNDFSKWDFWQDMAVPVLQEYKNRWKFFPDKRVSVQLINSDKNPIIGKKLKLIDEKKEVLWESVTDNRGNAELWGSSLIDNYLPSTKFSIVDEFGNILAANVKEFKYGQNLIKLNENCLRQRSLELAFVVDATGSMGDEINYLKSELLDVLKNVEKNLKNTKVTYGSVFYRDKGDEYVTKKFDFSESAEQMIGFIKNQNANGGGDLPEAVVEALETAIEELKWSNQNSTKLMFLLLDAPPHLSDENIERLQAKIKLASKKGITIIPIAASDTDKQTEYLMRTFALLTNGTYTFLTNDSGIGNNHIEPTASAYEVEKLNDLLLRLILQRSAVPDCKIGVTNEYLNKKLEVESIEEKEITTKIYPNPTKGNFKINSKEDIEEFTLYDYSGKILMRKENLKSGINLFDITAYPQSIYLVRLKYKTKAETFKIIKN